MLHVKRLWLTRCVFVLDKRKLFAPLSFFFPGFHIRAMDFLESFLKKRPEEICLFKELISVKMQPAPWNSGHYVRVFFAVRLWLQTAIIFHKTKNEVCCLL